MPVAPRVHRNAAYKPREPWARTQNKRKLTGRPWRRLREQILIRDEYRCQCEECKGIGLLADEVDHVVPVSRNGSDDPSNLRAINRECHKLKTQKEGGR